MDSSLPLVFASVMLEALPFILLGSFVSGLIEEFVSKERLASLLPGSVVASTALAALAGLVFPVCECGVVPVVRRLATKGLPLPACLAFLVAAPIVNPFVIASTALAYRMDLHMAVLRTAFGYLMAVSAGLLLGRFFKGSSFFNVAFLLGAAGSCSCCGASGDHSGHVHSGASSSERFTARLLRALRHASSDFVAMAPYLAVGAFIAALASVHVDRKAFLALSEQPVAAGGLMILLAFLLNLCSQADAFIAASFNGLLPFSSQMAFLLTGPVLDLKLLLMYRTVFKKKAILCFALFALAFTALAAFATHILIDGGRP